MNQENKKIITVAKEDGASLSIVGDTYRLVIAGEQTGSAYSVIDMLIPPGGGSGPHAHAGFHEAFFVLEGEIEVKTAAGVYTATQGSFVHIPSEV